MSHCQARLQAKTDSLAGETLHLGGPLVFSFSSGGEGDTIPACARTVAVHAVETAEAFATTPALELVAYAVLGSVESTQQDEEELEDTLVQPPSPFLETVPLLRTSPADKQLWAQERKKPRVAVAMGATIEQNQALMLQQLTPLTTAQEQLLLGQQEATKEIRSIRTAVTEAYEKAAKALKTVDTAHELATEALRIAKETARGGSDAMSTTGSMVSSSAVSRGAFQLGLMQFRFGRWEDAGLSDRECDTLFEKLSKEMPSRLNHLLDPGLADRIINRPIGKVMSMKLLAEVRPAMVSELTAKFTVRLQASLGKFSRATVEQDPILVAQNKPLVKVKRLVQHELSQKDSTVTTTVDFRARRVLATTAGKSVEMAAFDRYGDLHFTSVFFATG